MNERRDRFRRAMARFEPSGDPQQALTEGFFVEEPTQSVARQILARLELRPQSSHLIAGPIGSGKTTQLRVLEKLLKDSGEFLPIFLDVSTYGDKLRQEGNLLKQVVEDVRKHKATTLADKINEGQHGTGTKVVFAVLVGLATAASSVPSSNQPAVDRAALKRQLTSLSQKPVLLIDSLDRLSHPVFAEVCDGDLANVRELIAVVVVGPPAVMYGAARETTERFDNFVRQTAQNPREDSDARAFLMQVLRARADEALLPNSECERLVLASGGILRDLIALTQLALEEAYVAGHEGVDLRDVARAVDTFGRKHIIGLDSNELATLQRVRTRGTFVRVSDSDVGLLVTRRVLEYADEHGVTRFAVHPTLEPLLEQLDDPT